MDKLANLCFSAKIFGSDRFSGLLDQLFFTVATFASTYIYARSLRAEVFGLFALVQGICLVAQGAQRAICVLPMIVTSQNDAVGARWAQFDVVIRIVLAALLALASLCMSGMGSDPDTSHALLLAALCSPATLGYEFQRRCLFVQRRSCQVVVASATYLLMTLISIAAVVSFFPSADAAIIGLGISAFVSAIVARIFRNPLSETMGYMREHINLAVWNLLSYAAYAIYNNGMIVIVGLMLDVKSVALFSASRLFTAPIQTLLQAVDSVDTPRARRALVSDGVCGLSASLARTRMFLLIVGIPYLLIVLLAAPYLSDALFRARFPDMRSAIYGWVLVSTIMLLTQPMEIGLTLLKQVNLFFWSRLAAAMVTLIALISFSSKMGSITPVYSLCSGWALSGLIAWLLYGKSTGRFKEPTRV